MLQVKDLRVTLNTARGVGCARRGVNLQLDRAAMLWLIGQSGVNV